MSHPYQKVILSVVVIGSFFAMPLSTHAQSVLWTKTVRDTFSTNWGKVLMNSGGWTLNSPTMYVQYNTRAVNLETGQVLGCGSSVRQGTRVLFEILPHTSTDVAWFGSGSVYDSPYGSWNGGAGKPGSICQSKNEFVKKGYADFSVNPPSKSITGLPADQCTGTGTSMVCATSRAGTLTARYSFGATYGKFWGAASFLKKCVTDGNGLLKSQRGLEKIDIDAKALACSINVIAPTGQSPTNPVVTGNACVTGAAATYTAVSRHPDGSNPNTRLRYLFDWDSNGSVDQVVPGSGYVGQGVVQTVSHVWGTVGAKTFKVKAEDVQGKQSGWTSHAVAGCVQGELVGDPTRTTTVDPTQLLTPTVVTPTPDPDPVDPATLWSYPPGEGPVGVISASVAPRLTNTTCSLSWKTEHVTECKLYQQDKLIADVLVRGKRDIEPATYTIRCRQLKDNQIIRSLPQSCLWNPGVREI